MNSSLSRNCPQYTKIKKTNDEKAKKLQPKINGFANFFNPESFPPIGSRKQKNKKPPSQNDGPPSLNGPPPLKRMITASASGDDISRHIQISPFSNKAVPAIPAATSTPDNDVDETFDISSPSAFVEEVDISTSSQLIPFGLAQTILNSQSNIFSYNYSNSSSHNNDDSIANSSHNLTNNSNIHGD